MSDFEDLTGQKFGRLTVLKRAESRIQPSGQRVTQFLCKCECGNEKVIKARNLKNGNTKSCGCLAREESSKRAKKNISKFKDLTGQKFGRWTVIKRVENNDSQQAQWLCKCECGTEKILITHTLVSGSSKSCGCLVKDVQRKLQIEKNKKNLKDLTGKRVHKLTVIKRVENNKHGNPQWLCRCDCGNEIITTGSSLNGGRVHSCGCANRKLDAKIIGKKFGRLTVIRYVESRNNVSYYEAKCDCGNIIVTAGSSIYHGDSKSCGCLQREVASQMQAKDLKGQKFGRLKVIKKWGTDKHNRITWLCKCDCGNEIIVGSSSLLRGNTRSCGCLHHDYSKKEGIKHLDKIHQYRNHDRHFHIFGKDIIIPNFFKKQANVQCDKNDEMEI